MKEVFVLNKKIGETPLECLERFKKKFLKIDEKMTYAGRLDPMAEGLLIALRGKVLNKKERFLSLSKSYEAEILFGFATDTYDILGKIKNQKSKIGNEIQKTEIEKVLKKYIGKFMQEYPIYSSRTVKGGPLFEYARLNKNVKIPKKEVAVFSIRVLGSRRISSKKLLQNIEKKISKVKGDFRQKEILRLWKQSLRRNNFQFSIIKLRINCGGGFYVRKFADDLGKDLGVPAIAYSIKRTKIGRYKL